MFQIWRYRTSWEDFHSSTSWLKIFFDIFGESNGIWSNKIWTESWLASEGLSSYQSPHMTPCAWCHYYRCMTSWQHDNSEDISSILTQPADRVCSCSISRIFPHHVCGALAPRSMSVLGQHLQFTLIWRLSGQEPVSWVLHPFHYHYTCTESRPKLSFLAWAYRYPSQRGSCVKMNRWHPT